MKQRPKLISLGGVHHIEIRVVLHTRIYFLFPFSSVSLLCPFHSAGNSHVVEIMGNAARGVERREGRKGKREEKEKRREGKEGGGKEPPPRVASEQAQPHNAENPLRGCACPLATFARAEGARTPQRRSKSKCTLKCTLNSEVRRSKDMVGQVRRGGGKFRAGPCGGVFVFVCVCLCTFLCKGGQF